MENTMMTVEERIAREHKVAAAVRSARAGHLRGAWDLVGCPAGGWAQTKQAMAAIYNALPAGVPLRDFVAAAYCVDATGRYRPREP